MKNHVKADETLTSLPCVLMKGINSRLFDRIGMIDKININKIPNKIL